MPKQRITKEMVVQAAFEIARSGGMEEVLVKNIADKIGCSVQPIYSYCKNMDTLRQEVAQLAREEPNLFKIFILHQRKGISSLEDLYQAEASPQAAIFLADKLQISLQRARQLHLNMLLYTIGIGTVFAVATPGISADEIYTQQETAYEAFLKQALENKSVSSLWQKGKEQRWKRELSYIGLNMGLPGNMPNGWGRPRAMAGLKHPKP